MRTRRFAKAVPQDFQSGGGETRGRDYRHHPIVLKAPIKGRAMNLTRGSLKRGWANVPDEGIIGFNVFAAPISDVRGNLVAMIAVIGATRTLPRGQLPDSLIGLQQARSQIAAALGWSHAAPACVPQPVNRQERVTRSLPQEAKRRES
jgi:hypothetical protein